MQIRDPFVEARARLYSQGYAYLHLIANSTLLIYNSQVKCNDRHNPYNIKNRRKKYLDYLEGCYR